MKTLVHVRRTQKIIHIEDGKNLIENDPVRVDVYHLREDGSATHNGKPIACRVEGVGDPETLFHLPGISKPVPVCWEYLDPSIPPHVQEGQLLEESRVLCGGIPTGPFSRN